MIGLLMKIVAAKHGWLYSQNVLSEIFGIILETPLNIPARKLRIQTIFMLQEKNE